MTIECSTLFTLDSSIHRNVVQLSSMDSNETKVCSSSCLLPQIYDPQITSREIPFLCYFRGCELSKNCKHPKLNCSRSDFNFIHPRARVIETSEFSPKISVFCDFKSDECKISNFICALVFLRNRDQSIESENLLMTTTTTYQISACNLAHLMGLEVCPEEEFHRIIEVFRTLNTQHSHHVTISPMLNVAANDRRSLM
jgi:hypothetical protein